MLPRRRRRRIRGRVRVLVGNQAMQNLARMKIITVTRHSTLVMTHLNIPKLMVHIPKKIMVPKKIDLFVTYVVNNFKLFLRKTYTRKCAFHNQTFLVQEWRILLILNLERMVRRNLLHLFVSSVVRSLQIWFGSKST